VSALFAKLVQNTSRRSLQENTFDRIHIRPISRKGITGKNPDGDQSGQN
jgi:hypothetical protein